MKTKKEKALKMAVKLLIATKGNGNTPEMLKQVFQEIKNLTTED